jgi:tRNA pseudouridine55 synthase
MNKSLNAEQLKSGYTLLVDKPLDWTSFDVVNKLRFKLKNKFKDKKFKVGHAGTLDPKATGLLVICTGSFTKILDSLQSEHKEYTGTFTLGATTPSYDTETEPENIKPTEHIQLADIVAASQQFIGKIGQYPPMFSAIKKDGKKMYDLARQGETVELEARQIEIMRFEILRYEGQVVEFLVQCSKGTYIRSLAHDMGQALGCGAYLSALRRTASGKFSLADAWEVNELAKAIEDAE